MEEKRAAGHQDVWVLTVSTQVAGADATESGHLVGTCIFIYCAELAGKDPLCLPISPGKLMRKEGRQSQYLWFLLAIFWTVLGQLSRQWDEKVYPKLV